MNAAKQIEAPTGGIIDPAMGGLCALDCLKGAAIPQPSAIIDAVTGAFALPNERGPKLLQAVGRTGRTPQ
jgi:hypothetical protein